MIVKQVNLPFFTGFYHTFFDVFENLEIAEDEEELENSGDLTQEQYDDIDFKKSYIALSKKLVEKAPYRQFLFDNGINIIEDTAVLHSPQFYNYTNDTILTDVGISHVGAVNIADYLEENKDEFLEYYGTRYDAGMDEDEFDNFIQKLHNDDENVDEKGDLTIAMEFFYINQMGNGASIKDDVDSLVYEWLEQIYPMDIIEYNS